MPTPMAQWDADSRLEEIKRRQSKAAKGRIFLGAIFLVIGLVMSFYLIFFSKGLAGPLGILLGFAFLVVAIVGAVLIVTGYFDIKSAKIVSAGNMGQAPIGDQSMPARAESSDSAPPSLLGKELRWRRGEMKDTWIVEHGGRDVAKIGGKGTYPFSYVVNGEFDGTAFQMAIVKKPDKHWEVATGPNEKEWGKIWNPAVTHLSPAVVKTWDGRAFEIRDAGKKEKGLAFVVVGEGEKVVAETTYHTPTDGVMGAFAAIGLTSDTEIMVFALVCVVFAALLGPLESEGK